MVVGLRSGVGYGLEQEEFKKENPSDKYIKFLQQVMQNSQKRLDFAQQMLLQKQSQPSEDKITEDVIDQKIEGKDWRLPENPDVSPRFNREKELEQIKNYITNPCDFANKDGLFNLLGTSGMKGIGKTQLLLNSLQAVEKLSNTKAVYFTFNRHGDLKEKFQESRRQGHSHAKALGHAILTACYVPEELAMTCNFDECLELVSASSDERLVIFIDELGLLDAYEKEPVVVPLLRSLMRCMNKRKGKLVFVFSHLLEEMLKRGATDESGRKIDGIPLVALDIDIWRTNSGFSAWAEAARKHAGIHQLLLSCAGHPRCLFEGLKVVEDLCKSPPQTAIAYDRARQQIINECKFDGMEYTLEESMLMQRFSPLEQMNETALDRAGLLVRVKTGLGKETASFLHPLVLSWWAQKNKKSSRLAKHLCHAYEFDAELAEGSEKRMEGVMFYYEAVRRIALDGKPIELSQFYVTDYIGDNFKKMLLVGALPQGGGRLVEFVKDFSDVKLVIDWLKKGAIVVSQKQSEEGVEYLTPWRLNDAEGKLVVACVQCKFVKDKVPWSKVKKHMHSAVEPLKQKKIEVFPVIYATPDQDTIQESTYNDGVYFNEVSIFKFTSKLGILRLHTEKLGKSLQKEVPVLNRSRSEVAD
ncbi:unnamed protein product [Symbiodinium necroappetens]|uniref:Uncharacterized protein n=1 Tax=Symbiodinium necroappetens TaxID=1628268 RepID=A0A813CLP4_9DINO|nr:unnamed protein product [Symbiodinium necroappetens]